MSGRQLRQMEGGNGLPDLDGVGRLVRVREAARLLDVSERSIRAWISAGKFPVVRLSARCLRIPLDEFARFVESRREGAT